jgi:hypothetical protein
VDARVPAAGQAAPEKEWWLRSLAVFQSPSAVFMALRDDSEKQATARQEPVLALVWLAGIAGVLATPSRGTLLDNSDVDGLLVAVLIFLGGGMYGLATYFLGGGAVYLGARAAGGTGSYRRARHLLAYAAAPLVLLLVVVWPVRLAVYGDDLFRTGGADSTGAGRWLFEAVEAAVFAWAFVLLVLGIRAVHGWRLVRSLGSLVLAALALLAFGVAFSWLA